jgi:hypothetical protein
MTQNVDKRQQRAEALAKVVQYSSIPHPYESDRARNFKAYSVTVHGVAIGEVYQTHEAVHKKAGRLISSTRHVKRWSKSSKVPSAPEYVFYYDTRTEAVFSLLKRMLASGHDVQEGMLVRS